MNTLASDSIHTEEILLNEDGQVGGAATPRQHHQLTPAQVLSWLPKNATPEQQDSAIQANIKPSEITWSQQPDTLHLPGHTAGRSWRDVSKPEFQGDSFLHGQPYFNPELFGGRQGVAGDPVPYSIARDNVITGLLLFCFIIAAIAFAKSKRFIVKQARHFFRPPHDERTSGITETSGEVRVQFFFVLQSCLLFALMYFFHLQIRATDTFIIDQYQVIGVFALINLAYVLLKSAAYWLTGWVFFDRRLNDIWMKSYLFLLAMEGVCIFPAVMLQAYFEVPVETTLVCTGAVIALFKMLALYKSYIIFFRHSGHSLQIFLYFCTLELLPLMMLLGVLDIIGNCLKVNF